LKLRRFALHCAPHGSGNETIRKNLAIAIDGRWICGVIVTKALSMLEKAGAAIMTWRALMQGTSTGSIYFGCPGCLTADRIHDLYLSWVPNFPSELAIFFFPLTRPSDTVDAPWKAGAADQFGI
jgi:hypothetical protein